MLRKDVFGNQFRPNTHTHTHTHTHTTGAFHVHHPSTYTRPTACTHTHTRWQLADLLPRDQEGFNALFKIALKAKLDASDQSALDAASNRAASALNPNLMGDGGGGADASGSSDFDRRAAYRQTYQDVAKTVEYGEMNYYKLKVEQCNDPCLVGINQFWRDYANHSLGGGDGAWGPFSCLLSLTLFFCCFSGG